MTHPQLGEKVSVYGGDDATRFNHRRGWGAGHAALNPQHLPVAFAYVFPASYILSETSLFYTY